MIKKKSIESYKVIKNGAIKGVFLKKNASVKLNYIDAQTYLSQGKIEPTADKSKKQTK